MGKLINKLTDNIVPLTIIVCLFGVIILGFWKSKIFQRNFVQLTTQPTISAEQPMTPDGYFTMPANWKFVKIGHPQVKKHDKVVVSSENRICGAYVTTRDKFFIAERGIGCDNTELTFQYYLIDK